MPSASSSKRGASRSASRSKAAARPRPKPTRRATKPRRWPRPRAEEYTRAWMAIEALEQDVEKARARRLRGAQHHHRADRGARFGGGAARARRRSASRVSSSKRASLAPSSNARARSAWRRPKRCIARRRASIRRASRARRANRSWPARGSSTSGESRDVRTREQELAGMAARLRSLEEIDTHRGGFADAARMVLVNANGKVGQMGALADFIEVEPRYERAVEACLGDLLQHVLVERLEHVSAGPEVDPPGRRRPLRLRRRTARRFGARSITAARRSPSSSSTRLRVQRRDVPAGTVRAVSPWCASAGRSRAAHPGGDGRRADRRFVRGRRAHCADRSVPGGDARRRRLPRQARRHRRRQDRVARHPRHQARDQGAAREDHRGAGRARAPDDRDRRLRAGDGARDRGDRRADRRDSTARKRRSSACRRRPSARTDDEARVQQRADLVGSGDQPRARKRSPGSTRGRPKRANRSRG